VKRQRPERAGAHGRRTGHNGLAWMFRWLFPPVRRRPRAAGAAGQDERIYLAPF
jgi:hypothetical protein